MDDKASRAEKKTKEPYAKEKVLALLVIFDEISIRFSQKIDSGRWVTPSKSTKRFCRICGKKAIVWLDLYRAGASRDQNWKLKCTRRYLRVESV